MATQNFCSFHGSIMLESQMAIPTQLQQDVTASNILQCDFPCPGVPAESEIHYQMSYRNEDGFQFLAGAMAHANAKLIVKYNQNGEPYFTLLPRMLRSQPGNPEDDDYLDRLPPIFNPYITTAGPVVAIPHSSDECRIFTVKIHTYHPQPSGEKFLDFDLHCALPGNKRWEKTPLPKIGRGAFVEGHLIGLFRHDGRLSPIIKRVGVLFSERRTIVRGSNEPATRRSSFDSFVSFVLSEMAPSFANNSAAKTSDVPGWRNRGQRLSPNGRKWRGIHPPQPRQPPGPNPARPRQRKMRPLKPPPLYRMLYLSAPFPKRRRIPLRLRMTPVSFRLPKVIPFMIPTDQSNRNA